MNQNHTTRNVLVIILALIIGGVVGYFIAKGGSSQSASVYSIPTTQTQAIAVSNGTNPGDFMPSWLCGLLGGQARYHVNSLGNGNYSYDYIGCNFYAIASVGSSTPQIVMPTNASYSTTCSSVGGTVQKGTSGNTCYVAGNNYYTYAAAAVAKNSSIHLPSTLK